MFENGIVNNRILRFRHWLWSRRGRRVWLYLRIRARIIWEAIPIPTKTFAPSGSECDGCSDQCGKHYSHNNDGHGFSERPFLDVPNDFLSGFVHIWHVFSPPYADRYPIVGSPTRAP